MSEIEELQDDAQYPAKRLIKAYKTVFGMPGKMTTSQKLVFDDLVKRWKIKEPSFFPNYDNLSMTAGQMKNIVTYDPIKAAITDGAKMPVFQIIAFLEAQEDKPKPKVKTTR